MMSFRRSALAEHAFEFKIEKSIHIFEVKHMLQCCTEVLVQRKGEELKWSSSPFVEEDTSLLTDEKLIDTCSKPAL